MAQMDPNLIILCRVYWERVKYKHMYTDEEKKHKHACIHEEGKMRGTGRGETVSEGGRGGGGEGGGKKRVRERGREGERV